jgi:pantetheine-phosphate adenylyltransferase
MRCGGYVLSTSPIGCQRTAALGGTFEKLHKGHRRIILRALQVADSLIIGLSSDRFSASMKKGHPIKPYNVRLADLKAFLRAVRALGRVDIVPLDDPYGPTISDSSIGAVVVSPETLKTAIEIRRIRLEKRLGPLQIYVVDFVLADDGKPISSSRVSLGTIAAEGRSLKTPP